MKVVVVFTIVGYLASASSALATAGADKRSSPAKGTKSCKISQYDSKYIAEHGNITAFTLPRPFVHKDGSVEMGLADETYPGTRVYYLIAGHRYSGDAGYMVPLDRVAVEALKKDPVIHFTFSRWPYRAEINGTDIIEGFQAAYKDCLLFLNSPKP